MCSTSNMPICHAICKIEFCAHIIFERDNVEPILQATVQRDLTGESCVNKALLDAIADLVLLLTVKASQEPQAKLRRNYQSFARGAGSLLAENR
jgi:hypothetical protein